MKTLKALSIILMAIMIFAIPLTANAQDVVANKTKLGNDGLVISFSTDVDSLSTVNTDWFTLANYDNISFITYPPSVEIKQSSASALPHLTVTVEASFDADNVAAVYDTLEAVADSSESLQVTTFSTFNTTKFPYYRIKVTGEAHNRVDANILFWAYFYKKF